MVHEFLKPVPCKTPLGDGYVWYMITGGFLENDEYCVILSSDGRVRHFASCDVTIWPNGTYGINLTKEPPLPF